MSEKQENHAENRSTEKDVGSDDTEIDKLTQKNAADWKSSLAAIRPKRRISRARFFVLGQNVPREVHDIDLQEKRNKSDEKANTVCKSVMEQQ